MERGGIGPWNAKENGNTCFPSPGGDNIAQSLRNHLNKSGKIFIFSESSANNYHKVQIIFLSSLIKSNNFFMYSPNCYN